MSAATVSALALISLMIFFIIESRPQKKTTLSMLDLAEFKDLPSELRTMIKSAMPNSAQLKKHWNQMVPQQKQLVMQQISSQFPKTPQRDTRPPAPSVVIKPPGTSPKGLKPGFLLPDSVNKSQKKNPKDKKHNKVVTLSDIGSSEDEETVVSTEITDADA